MLSEKDLQEIILTVKAGEDVMQREETISLDELIAAEHAEHDKPIFARDKRALYNIFKD